MLAGTILLLCSCSSDIIAEHADAGSKAKKDIKFVISPYETELMRASTSEAFTRLSFVLFPTIPGDTIVVEQEKNDGNFATVSAAVPFGTYELVVVGHNGSENAIVESAENISFQDNKITDTFCHYQTVEITSETSSTMEIKLKRSVAKMEVKVTDALPEWLAKVQIIATGGGVALNPKTGLAAAEAVQNKTSEIKDIWLGTKFCTFSTYTFLPSDGEVNMSFTVNAIDGTGETILSRLFDNVPMTVNQITRYTGEFFNSSSEVGGKITADAAWEEENEYSF